MPAFVKRVRLHQPTVALLLLAAWVGCGRGKRAEVRPADQELDAAVQPAALVSSLRRMAGGHFHATARFRVNPAVGPDAGSRDDITTTTDLWIDKQGNFRLSESNDQDGGREVVRVGPELAVALRYGKVIRRPAQDPEPQQFLEEGVGSPSAAWDTVRRFVAVEPAGHRAFRLGKIAQPGPTPIAATALRKWRETVEVQTLVGDARLDASGGLQAFSLSARFRALRDGTPIEGEIAVAATVDEVVTPITMPAAEPLQARERTILEERALLGGLGGRTPPVQPLPKKASPGRRPGAAAGAAKETKAHTQKPSTGRPPASGKKATP